MMRLASADMVFCFGGQRSIFRFGTALLSRAKCGDVTKYLTNFMRGRGFCGSRPTNGVPEILHSNVRIRNASSKSGLCSGEMPRHEHEL